MGDWTYRLVVTAENEEARDIEICEVYYDDDGQPTEGFASGAPGTTEFKEEHGRLETRPRIIAALRLMEAALELSILKPDVVGVLVDTGEMLP